MQTIVPTDEFFLTQAVEMAYKNVQEGGRPFAAVIVSDGQVIASAVNEIHISHDPTAHAELLAIRRCSHILQRPNLSGCIVYASGHPCPMCLSAMHLSGIGQVKYAYSNEEAEPFGLSTSHIYAQMQQPIAAQNIQANYVPIRLQEQENLYQVWKAKQDLLAQ